MRGTPHHGLRQLALVAMIVHALLPVGWMPSANLAAPITICTGNGALNHLPGDNAGGDKAPAGHHAPCPFATAFYYLAGAPAQPTLFVSVAGTRIILVDPGDAPVLRVPFKPGSPRAPPLNA
jgi:hypothetical protein